MSFDNIEAQSMMQNINKIYYPSGSLDLNSYEVGEFSYEIKEEENHRFLVITCRYPTYYYRADEPLTGLDKFVTKMPWRAPVVIILSMNDRNNDKPVYIAYICTHDDTDRTNNGNGHYRFLINGTKAVDISYIGLLELMHYEE
jgi:hypothetical protein